MALEGSAKTGRMDAAEDPHIPTVFCRKHPNAFYWYE